MMLYHCRGISDSCRTYFTWFAMVTSPTAVLSVRNGSRVAPLAEVRDGTSPLRRRVVALSALQALDAVAVELTGFEAAETGRICLRGRRAAGTGVRRIGRPSLSRAVRLGA